MNRVQRRAAERKRVMEGREDREFILMSHNTTRYIVPGEFGARWRCFCGKGGRIAPGFRPLVVSHQGGPSLVTSVLSGEL